MVGQMNSCKQKAAPKSGQLVACQPFSQHLLDHAPEENFFSNRAKQQ